MKQKNIYASLEGFKYYIKKKPYAGGYVAMENFCGGLLKYGNFDEYHSYFDDSFFKTLTKEELKKAFFSDKKLKFRPLSALLKIENFNSSYKVIHNEDVMPDKEAIFRNLLPKKNIALTRQVYTIATCAHLREFLDICLLSNGSRPYDSIIAPSKSVKEVLESYFQDLSEFTGLRVAYNGRLDVIPHGIDTECLKPFEKNESRKKLDLPCDTLILLSTARLRSVSKMNYDRLILFFSQLLKSSDKDLLLLITGADRNNEALSIMKIAEELKVNNKVKFITNFSDALKPYIFSCADIFVSLSDNLQESFGISLIEAMACGLPVICTDWDGYKDIVKDGVTGFKIPIIWKVKNSLSDILTGFRNAYDHSVIYRISRELHIDMELLIKKALDLIDNEALRKEMSKACRQTAEREYSLKTVISRFEGLWDELSLMAESDTKVYPDLSSMLNYKYPRHFKAYPTGIAE